MSQAASTRPVVLVVDDTPTNIETLVAVLERDHDVRVATSSAQALSLIDKGLQPELILLDVMMPDMDGFAVCARLKGMEAAREVPVIFVTARADIESESRALEVGAVDFLQKPISKDIVRLRVGLHLALARQRRCLEALNHRLAQSLTDVENANARLRELAYFDPLTGLANRALFFDRLERSLAHAGRSEAALALLFIDLDRFKPINDTWGHAVGDLVLQEVARRLTHSVRSADSVGRIGGDEFVVLLIDIARDTEAMSVAEKIRRNVAEPVVIADKTLSLSSSIGVALAPQHGRNPAELTGHADAAMYQAKLAGRDAIRLYAPHMAQPLRAAGRA